MADSFVKVAEMYSKRRPGQSNDGASGGVLGNDRILPSGDAIANIAVATSYRSKDRNTGEQKELTEWHRVSFFGRLAEIVGQYLKKGSSVYVEGRLQTRKYTDKNGIERYATDIIAENMQMLGGRQGMGRGSDMRLRRTARSAGFRWQGCPPGIAQCRTSRIWTTTSRREARYGGVSSGRFGELLARKYAFGGWCSSLPP